MVQLLGYDPVRLYQQNTSAPGSYASAQASNGQMTLPGTGSGNNFPNLFGGMNQLDNTVGGMQNQSNDPMQMMAGMMQMMMQMFMQLMGMTPGQNNQNNGNASQIPGSANQQTGNNINGVNNNQQNNNDLLGKIDQKELDAVKGKDLNAVDSKGYPKYLISKGQDGKYHVYEQAKDGDGKEYKSPTKLKQGNNKLHVKDAEANKKAATEAKNNSQTGVANNGQTTSSAAAASSSTSSITYNPTTGEITFTQSTASSSASSTTTGGNSSNPLNPEPPGESGTPLENKGGGGTGSPLILDTNKDGKVSAQQGKGVDVNGDGKADGAATDGDKMMSMGDVDGDGQITGKEVFGNETVDPFSGKKLNAKNGFDALNQVAKSAEKNTGIKCMDDNGNVDVQKLKQALEMSGKGSLGMISDNNTTNLEEIGDVASINTSNYKTQNQTGDVQHNQLGSFTDKQGNNQKVDDVWFKLA